MEDTRTSWRKSSYSGPSGGQCVEAANPAPATVAVRDTADRGGVSLSFPAAAWQEFTATAEAPAHQAARARLRHAIEAYETGEGEITQAEMDTVIAKMGGL